MFDKISYENKHSFNDENHDEKDCFEKDFFDDEKSRKPKGKKIKKMRNNFDR